jgi:hypothetical protein
MENIKTRVVIEFEQTCPNETKKWLETKLSMAKHRNGCDLSVMFSGNTKNKVSTEFFQSQTRVNFI